MTPPRMSLFIRSVQKELRMERRAVKDFVHGDALLRRYFEVFLFEDLPAADRMADDVYLEEVERSDLYVGLFANEYGNEDHEGLSPTEREFEHATAKGKTRLVFVKGTDDKVRHPRMLKLIRNAGSQLIRRRFTGIPDLNAALYASLVEHLERSGELRTLPFDASACPRATMDDIASIPRNPLIAEPLYLAHYIEKAGTGTLDMIALCREVGLPEPDFEQRAGQFVVTLWRDWLTGDAIATLGLNERQRKSVSYVRQEGRISNTIYQTLTGVAKRTAHRDLTELVEKGVFRRVGKTGKGTFYEFMKGATKGPKGP